MSPSRVLVTGVTGFVGRHLARYLRSRGTEVVGTSLAGRAPGPTAGEGDAVRVWRARITDRPAMVRVLRSARPDAVVHLAAASRVGSSWEDPAATVETNVLGTLALLEAVREVGLDPLILSVGSGDEYGLVKEDELPVRETNPLRPANPYAVSKAAQGLLAVQYARKFGLRVAHVRPFNHIGPGQSLGFITADLAHQIARAERRQGEPVLRVGNLETRRDYLDVRDVVRAYALLAELAEPGETYNVASGEARSGREILQVLLALTPVRMEVAQDPALLRPADVPVVTGDASRLRRLTGWRPDYSLEQSLADVLDYWREAVGS